MASLTQNSIGAVGIWRGVLPIKAFVNRVQPEGSLNPSDHTMASLGTWVSLRTNPWRSRNHRKALE